MGKQLKWKVSVDGEDYSVECVTQRTVYDVYVDGELMLQVPRKLRNDDTDSEYDLRIGSKRCQFVVYGGEADLCMDGILLGAQRQLERQERNSRLLRMIGGMALILVNTYSIFLWTAYRLADDPIFGGYIAPILFSALIILGVWMLLSSRKKKKE